MDDIPDLVEDLGTDSVPELVGEEKITSPSPVGLESRTESNSIRATDDLGSFSKSSLGPASVPLNDNDNDAEKTKKIPITIITGYLGSGKSTLLEKIGKRSNKRLAIILNEFGDSSVIEKSITIKDAEKNESIQEWLDLGNGCLCCTVKDNGVAAIEQLVENSKDHIDYILLETTGIADPAPIAKMFWIDQGLSSNIYIDGVITVVDSEHILTCLDDVGGHWHREHNHLITSQATNKEDLTEEEIAQEEAKLKEGITTAHLQIALADTILVNKVDRLEGSEEKLDEITKRIRDINLSSPIHPTSFGDIDLDKILDLHSFEANVEKLQKAINFQGGSSFHDSRIKTITISFDFFTSEEQFQQIEAFLQYVLWESTVNSKTVEIHRMKGLLVKKNEKEVDVRVVQGVRDTYDIIEGGVLIDGVTENKLVFIGKNLSHDDLMIELKRFLK
ncbi:CobW/HypB/UreG, nucleotide-binding domain-containing protein [Scheffersomyces xylosifermentans]|uniref:CobW/HypB/UreG, nucleotide-binding domain-containing protein n=1 Tax=Scheffersomyces xylosifermentans TaxID=1304137 RepID=UPI00315DF809